MLSLVTPLRQLTTLAKAPWGTIDDTSRNGLHRQKVNWITVFDSFSELQDLWPKINQTPIHHKNVTLALRVQYQKDLDQLKNVIRYQKYIGSFALCCQPLEQIDLSESLVTWKQIDWILVIPPEKPPQLDWLKTIYDQVHNTNVPIFFDILEWHEFTNHIVSNYDNLPKWLRVRQLMRPDIDNEGYIVV